MDSTEHVCMLKSISYARAFKDRNWLEFSTVLDAAFANPEDKLVTLENITKTREFFGKVVEEDGMKDRSAHLGLLELEKRSRQHGLATDSTTLNSLLEAYFQNFGGKPCCYEDLQPYVELEGEELARWTSVLEKQTASAVRVSFLSL